MVTAMLKGKEKVEQFVSVSGYQKWNNKDVLALIVTGTFFVGLNPSPMLLGADVQCPLRSDSGMQKFSSSPQITVNTVVSQDLLNR